MDKNFLGGEIKWVWIMRKLNTPFSVSTYTEGSNMGKKVFGYPQPLSTIWYDNGDIYFEENEISYIKKFIRYKINHDYQYPDKIASDIFDLVKDIKKQKIIPKTNNLGELSGQFKEESIFFFKLIGYISYRGAVQMCDVIQEKVSDVINFRTAEINKVDKASNYLDILSTPFKDSVVVEERIYKLNLALGYSKLSPDEQEERIDAYFEKYGWLYYHWLVGNPPTREEIKLRLLSLESDVYKEKCLIKEKRKKKEEEIKKIEKYLRFNSDEKYLIKQYRVWILMRTFIKDHINLAGFKLLPILHKMALILEIEQKSMVFLTVNELFEIEKISRHDIIEKIEERKKGFSAGIINNVFRFANFKIKNNKENNLKDVIKGSIACNGVVRGIVRVIMFPKDQNRLNNGEILVTSMTTPDYLPAMERAAAFVTDEGGITCHAAIISREMNKPCIIGTKIATKILKDGDLVEVDAERGVVRVLK